VLSPHLTEARGGMEKKLGKVGMIFLKIDLSKSEVRNEK
jgi:hypothetical protein